MESMPGDNFKDITNNFTDEELLSIQKELAYVLNELVKINVTLTSQHPRFLQYDRKNDKL